MAYIQVMERTVSWSSPLLMGVLNANTDSFSDPGPRTLGSIIDQGLTLAASGATIIDVGAQSSITGRAAIDASVEANAITPVIEELVSARPDVLISVDTFKPTVARAALESGAHIINDVSGLSNIGIAELCSEYGAGLVIMHTASAPLTRRQDPKLYSDVAAEVAAFLGDRCRAAIEAGMGKQSIIVDPGPDFAKTPAQTIELLRNIDQIVVLGHPILLALSRKDFIGALTGRAPAERDPGTLGAIAAMRNVPGQILRVHNVPAIRDMLAVLDTLTSALPIPSTLALPEHIRHQATDGIQNPFCD